MSIEIFTSVLAALMLFRLLSPIIDRMAFWIFGGASHASQAQSGSASANSIGRPLNHDAY